MWTEAKFKTPADQEGKHISRLGFGWREINYCTLAFTKKVLLLASEVFVTKQKRRNTPEFHRTHFWSVSCNVYLSTRWKIPHILTKDKLSTRKNAHDTCS